MAEKTDYDDIRRMFPGEVLSDSQIEFARQYHACGVGMRSVREAGYAFSTPGSQAAASNRLLKNKKIKRLLELFKEGSIT